MNTDTHAAPARGHHDTNQAEHSRPRGICVGRVKRKTVRNQAAMNGVVNPRRVSHLHFGSLSLTPDTKEHQALSFPDQEVQ